MDAYRIEALDFDTRLRVGLAEAPPGYRLALLDWNGDPLQTPEGGAIDATLPLPGSYYVVVRGPGEANGGTEPYRIAARLTSAAPPPRVLRSTDFRSEEDEAFSGSDPNAEYGKEGGYYTVTLKRPERPDDGQHALAT